MNRYKTCAELKDMAKGCLEGHYGASILAVLSVECIQLLVSYSISLMIPGTDFLSSVISLLISAVAAVFLGIYQTGLSLFFLKTACGQYAKSEDVFYGMYYQPSRSITVSFAITAANFLCTTPYKIFVLLYLDTRQSNYLSLALALAVLGLLIYIPISLILSQSYFLLLDFPDYSGAKALSSSCKIMKGNVGRLFLLQISFLPLLLLGAFTFGIGMLWITPYMNTTYALFFLDIMNPRKVAKEKNNERK